MSATDVQYAQMESVKAWLVSKMPPRFKLQNENCLIVDKSRHIDQVSGDFYIQIYDAIGSKGIMDEGGNQFLEWMLGISVRGQFMSDEPNILVEATKRIRDASMNIYNLIHLQYAIDTVNIPEPPRLRSITRVKTSFGENFPLEMNVEHQYALRAYYKWESIA